MSRGFRRAQGAQTNIASSAPPLQRASALLGKRPLRSGRETTILDCRLRPVFCLYRGDIARFVYSVPVFICFAVVQGHLFATNPAAGFPDRSETSHRRPPRRTTPSVGARRPLSTPFTAKVFPFWNFCRPPSLFFLQPGILPQAQTVYSEVISAT